MASVFISHLELRSLVIFAELCTLLALLSSVCIKIQIYYQFCPSYTCQSHCFSLTSTALNLNFLFCPDLRLSDMFLAIKETVACKLLDPKTSFGLITLPLLTFGQ